MDGARKWNQCCPGGGYSLCNWFESPTPPLTSPFTHHTAKQASIMRVLRQHGIFSFLVKFRDLAILLYLGSRPKSLPDTALGLWLQQEKTVRRVRHRVTTEKVYTGKPLILLTGTEHSAFGLSDCFLVVVNERTSYLSHIITPMRCLVISGTKNATRSKKV